MPVAEAVMQPTDRQKTVGRRAQPWRVSPEQALTWQTRAATLFGRRPVCPRGVFRFRSHEEADEWMLRALATRGRAALRRTTSFESPGG